MRGLRLLTISGIEVRADWSLLIIFLLITTSLASGLFPAWHPEWSPALAWTTALAAALLFFGSVLAHELSHALVGRAQGMQVRRITLFVFGGMAEIEHEPDRWRAELWMAIVGPVTSLVIGALCLAVAGIRIDPAILENPAPVEALLTRIGPAATLLIWLGQVNIVLALFNLVPGFPLDGGRVLRALMWGLTGDLRRATRLASTLGQVFAWVLIASGVMMLLGATIPVLGGGPVNGLWLAFIGWFLNSAALMSYHQLLVREALQNVPVSRLMQRRFDVVGPQTPVGDLIHKRIVESGQRAFPVLEQERLVGIVTMHDVEKADRTRRESIAVVEIMTPAKRMLTVRPDDDAVDALTLLAQRNVRQLPVIEGTRLVGLLRTEDIVRWLALHSDAPLARATAMRGTR